VEIIDKYFELKVISHDEGIGAVVHDWKCKLCDWRKVFPMTGSCDGSYEFVDRESEGLMNHIKLHLLDVQMEALK
jgi:hypothetical protein